MQRMTERLASPPLYYAVNAAPRRIAGCDDDAGIARQFMISISSIHHAAPLAMAYVMAGALPLTPFAPATLPPISFRCFD